jgi:hypothetical protein
MTDEQPMESAPTKATEPRESESYKYPDASVLLALQTTHNMVGDILDHGVPSLYRTRACRPVCPSVRRRHQLASA